MITSMAGKKSSELDLFTNGEITLNPRDELPKGQDLRYIAQGFARTSLPYQQPKKGTMSWTRRNGDWRLTVTPGMTEDEHGHEIPMKFPSGTIPRLLCCWFATQAVLTGQRKLSLGMNITDFMVEIGMKTSNVTGGERGMVRMMREQFEALCQASVSLRYAGDPSRQAGARASVAADYDLKWARGRRGQLALAEESTVTLSQEFFDSCTKHPVPVDMNTIQKLRGAAMRIDQYWWLTQKMATLTDPMLVSFGSLGLQFGSAINSTQAERTFETNFTNNLLITLDIYKGARAKPIPGKGVLLLPGYTDIPKREEREMLKMAAAWQARAALEPAF